jgi:hypothetical protein
LGAKRQKKEAPCVRDAPLLHLTKVNLANQMELVKPNFQRCGANIFILIFWSDFLSPRPWKSTPKSLIHAFQESQWFETAPNESTKKRRRPAWETPPCHFSSNCIYLAKRNLSSPISPIFKVAGAKFFNVPFRSDFLAVAAWNVKCLA